MRCGRIKRRLWGENRQHSLTIWRRSDLAESKSKKINGLKANPDSLSAGFSTCWVGYLVWDVTCYLILCIWNILTCLGERPLLGRYRHQLIRQIKGNRTESPFNGSIVLHSYKIISTPSKLGPQLFRFIFLSTKCLACNAHLLSRFPTQAIGIDNKKSIWRDRDFWSASVKQNFTRLYNNSMLNGSLWPQDPGSWKIEPFILSDIH